MQLSVPTNPASPEKNARFLNITLDEFVAANVDQRLAAFQSGALKAKLTRRERLNMILMFGRPRTAIPGVIAFALGAAYTTAEFSLRTTVLGVLMFMCAFLANILNTWTDVDEDIRNLPGRTYLMGVYGHKALGWTSLLLAMAMALSAAALGLEAFIGMLACLLVVHQYSLQPVLAKKRPIVGLLMFSQAVLLPFLMGAVAESDSAFAWDVVRVLVGGEVAHETAHTVTRFLAMAGFLFVWFLAKGMYKNVPDYYGDRAAGVRTSASIFPTWRSAAIAASVATIGAYLLLGSLVILGLEAPRVAFSLIWLVPVTWNCYRLVRADGIEKGNQCLKIDMIISSGFISTLLCLLVPSWGSFALVSLGLAIILVSDWLNIDTRRNNDVTKTAA